MDSEWLIKARRLRDEAYEALLTNPAYMAFKAFDDAVISLGGAPMFELRATSSPVHEAAKRIVETVSKRAGESAKLAQGDAAEIVLRQAKRPLPISKLMQQAIERGAEIGGSDPLGNFRSTLSKDDRFTAIRRGPFYVWWLAGEPLPPIVSETAVQRNQVETAASLISSGQKGGDGDAPSAS